MNTRTRTTVLLFAIAMSLVGVNEALAHEGHAHGDSGGMVGGLVDIAVVAAALIILYVLATWYFRYRDR